MDMIDRQQAIDALGEEPLAWEDSDYELGCVNQWKSDVEAIKALPSAEPQERKTGRWETVKANPRMMHCTNCMGTWWNKEFIEVFKFCPECGKRMEGTDGR